MTKEPAFEMPALYFYNNEMIHTISGATNRAGRKLAVRIFLISKRLLMAMAVRMIPPAAVNSVIMSVVTKLCTCAASRLMDPW